MGTVNINRVVITGNLTRDPELRSLPSGMSVCKLGIACNTRRKDQSSGRVDKPNYFNVTVWGAQGENARALPLQGTAGGRASHGRLSGASGRRRTGQSARESISLPTRCSSWYLCDSSGGGSFAETSSRCGHPLVNEGDFQPAPVGAAGRSSIGGDDDIPF